MTIIDGIVHLRVRDNGRGGADFSHGSGRVGLKDRTKAFSGHLKLDSRLRESTTLEITLPLHDPGGPGLAPGAESCIR